MDNWTQDFPTEAGLYWFYGYRYNDNTPEYALVTAHMGNSGITLIADGQFMYASDVKNAHFMPAEYPSIPSTWEGSP